MQRLLLVAIVAGFILGGSGLAPNSARAYHTYEERLLDSTAYSLDRRGFRLGMFKLSYGIIDQLQISSYTMPWLLGLVFEDVAPNIDFKSTFYNRKRLALSASFGFLSGAIEQVAGVERTRVGYFLTPVSLAASVRINSRVSTHVGGMFTAVTGDLDTNPEATDIAGATVVDVLQFWGMVEWRLSRVVAFTFTVRWVPWVSSLLVRGKLDSDNPDIGIGIEVDVSDLTNTFAVIPGFVFSWKRANIRLGVGYGDFFVEGFALVIPGNVLNYVSPEFDIFVRF